MRMVKKISVIFIFVVILVSLCACNDSVQQYPTSVSLSDNQIFVYEPFACQLGIYDTKSHEWSNLNVNNSPFLAYDFGNIYPYFTVGNVGTEKYFLGKINRNSLDFNFNLDDEEIALVPFATDGEKFFYIVEQMNINPCKKQIITISDDGKMELIADLDGIGVMDGIIIGNYIYYTAPCSDNCGNSSVWCIDISENNENQKSVLIKDEYTNYQLFEFNDEVLYLDSENNVLYNENRTINLSRESSIIWIDDSTNILAEKYVNEDGDLAICFTDISKSKSLGDFINAINFKIEDNKITIYGKGYIKNINLL